MSQYLILPLAVMLLLTGLVGVTAYRLTDTWAQAAESTTNTAVQAVLMTHVRWNLHQANNALGHDPHVAAQYWQSARQQTIMLSEISPKNANVHMLRNFLEREENIQNIGPLLEKELFNIKLSEMQQRLDNLQARSRFVTMAVTLCMLALGLVLTAITAWDSSRLVRALLRSRDMNVRIQEEERRRIAQDLHDGAVQELIDLKRNYQPHKVDRLINNLRRVCHNLKPQVLDDLGLAAALEFLADDLRQAGVASVQVNVDGDSLARLPKAYELPIFRVVQELCSNIKHHAQAGQVKLTVVYDPDESPMLRGYISDNGHGFHPEAVGPERMGLAGVQERIQQMGGQLLIRSGPGQGSQFQFMIPVQANADTAIAS